MWTSERFTQYGGVTRETTAKNKHDLYVGFLPVLNSGCVELLDHQRSINQILSLERTRTKIDHPPRGHDDCANAIAGAVDARSVGMVRTSALCRWLGVTSMTDETDTPQARLGRLVARRCQQRRHCRQGERGSGAADFQQARAYRYLALGGTDDIRCFGMVLVRQQTKEVFR